MRLSKSRTFGCFFCALMIILSMSWSIVTNVLNTDQKYASKNVLEKNQPNSIPMGNESNYLVWVLQVSDIHLSLFTDLSRISEFKEFCNSTLKVYKPPVVLVTGDLTDAMLWDDTGSQQLHEEWVIYRDILKNLSVTNQTTWLDIRGNHDTFNVINFQSKANYFENYSVQGKQHARSYYHQIVKDNEIYSFVAIDASLIPGPASPFNFAGFLDLNERSVIKNIVHEVELSGSKYTIWIGHFPTSFIFSHEPGGFRSLIGRHRQTLAYLCGHLHTIGGLMPEMYTLQQDGFLELELGDWRHNRMYRLLAIDHGLQSFVDVKHNEWPVVLITNPKDALFVIPYKENLNTVATSTHIRILAFSSAPIDHVKARIDNGDWVICRHKDGPLYTALWHPELYNFGVHKIEVNVTDKVGRSKYRSQPFSLDESRFSFDVLRRFALMGNASTFFKIIFYLGIVLGTFPLLICRLISYLPITIRIRRPLAQRSRIFRSLVRKFCILSSIDRIFWPLILYPIYLIVGPWSFGYIVEDHFGIIFAWGILIDGVFIPESITYFYGSIEIYMFQLQITWIFAFAVDHRFQCFLNRRPMGSPTVLSILFIFFSFIQSIMTICFWRSYGTLSFILCPVWTWPLFIAITMWCWLMCFSLPHHYAIWDAVRIWTEPHMRYISL